MTAPAENVETIQDTNNGTETKEHASSRVPLWLRKWCYCCRNCTGAFIVFGIVNGVTIFMLYLTGSLLGAILENSGSNVMDKYNLDLIVFLATQFCVLTMNLLTVYCLCRRYNSAGRDYKAMLYVFHCCRRTNRRVYPETIRPVRDVVSDVCWNGASLVFRDGCDIRAIAVAVLLFVVGAVLILCFAITLEQNQMLLWLGLASFLLWIFLFVLWLTKGGTGIVEQPEEEESQQKAQAPPPSGENDEAIMAQVSETEIV